jgi:ABC-type phosphate transport system substrate-binding protein
MKLNLIAVAIAGLAANSAFALDINTTAPQVTIRVAGASAQDGDFKTITKSFCDTVKNDNTEYTTTVKNAQGNATGFGEFCTFASSGLPASIAGKKVLVIKNGDGSLFGVQPVLLNTSSVNGQNVEFLNVAAGVCTAAGACNTGYPFSTISPDAGVADVEPAMFDPTLPTSTATLTTTALQGFGIAVSAPLYAALQAAKMTVDGTTTGVPSLNRSQVTALFSGSGGYFQASDWSVLVGASGAGKKIVLSRREDTSGTEKAFEAYFLDAPCSTGPQLGAQTMVHATDSISGSYEVSEFASTGNLVASLNTTDWALGFATLQKKPGGTDTWKFIALNGVSPLDGTHPTGPSSADYQRYNTINGTYDWSFETVAIVDNAGPQATKDFMAQLNTKLQDPSKSNIVGLAMIPGSGPNGTYESDTNNPKRVALTSRVGNSCQAPIAF